MCRRCLSLGSCKTPLTPNFSQNHLFALLGNEVLEPARVDFMVLIFGEILTYIIVLQKWQAAKDSDSGLVHDSRFQCGAASRHTVIPLHSPEKKSLYKVTINPTWFEG